MIIGLDYDDTYTVDPEFWDSVVELAHSRGHKVLVVTARHGTAENREDVVVPGIHQKDHHFTGMIAKRWFMNEQGIEVHCWVDDSPEYIIHGV